MVPSISNSMYADTLHGMSDVLRDAGYFLAVAHTGYSRREEFEVVKAMARKAREENEALAARLDALEARLAAVKSD